MQCGFAPHLQIVSFKKNYILSLGQITFFFKGIQLEISLFQIFTSCNQAVWILYLVCQNGDPPGLLKSFRAIEPVRLIGMGCHSHVSFKKLFNILSFIPNTLKYPYRCWMDLPVVRRNILCCSWRRVLKDRVLFRLFFTRVFFHLVFGRHPYNNFLARCYGK